jgi:tetratricopeptide (TPR) repeat protein
MGDNQGAIRDYSKVIKLNPNDTEIYKKRATVKKEMGNYRGATNDLNCAIVTCWFNMGKMLHEMGDKQGSIDNYSQAIKLNPNYAIAYNNRGYVRYEMGDKQGAIDDYSQAIKLNPKQPQAYYNRGYVREEMGDYRGATEDYNQASILGIGGKL